MKGIILAGGTGSRLYPATFACSKQLLSVYDKPMIYYSLSVLLLLGLKEILIITTEKDLGLYKNLLKDGSNFGIKIEYAVQKKPRGIADAFIVGEYFIGNDRVCLILGDNLFCGLNFEYSLKKAALFKKGAVIFAAKVKNPQDFGIVEFDEKGSVISIKEKPLNSNSSFAVTGLYFYDNSVIEIAKKVKASERGELEISSVNEEYRKMGKLKVLLLEKGTAWLDTGTHKDLLIAANFVELVQTRQGIYIGCLEEIAYKKGFIDKEKLISLGKAMEKTDYGKHILSVAEE